MFKNAMHDHRLFAAEGEGAPAGADTANPPANPATNPATTSKWWEGEAFADPARQYLTAKGLTLEDPMLAMPKLIDIASNAEKRIGRGLDTIIERPGKDQPYDQWIAANRAALGLPADAAAYEIAPPADWPKDAPWDKATETKARDIAVKYGIPQAALAELVGLQASTAMAFMQDNAALSQKAHDEMMADLQKDFGDQTKQVVQQAKQAAIAVGQQAGLPMDGLQNMMDAMSESVGDANVIRFMHALSKMMSDDSGVGMGKGAPMAMTPAEARQRRAQMMGTDGEYYKATQTNDRAALARLQPIMDQLARIASQG